MNESDDGDIKFFCPETGLLVLTRPEWIGRKVGRNMIANFYIIGDSILYSAPSGIADLSGVQASLELNDEVALHLSGNTGSYIQIEDYALLKSASFEARRYFLKSVNTNQRRLSLVFCNLSPLISIGVKIGNRFVNPKKQIFVKNHYGDSIKWALQICEEQKLEKGVFVFGAQVQYQKDNQYFHPVELCTRKTWEVQTDEYFSQGMVIDRHIFHSASRGYLRKGSIKAIDEAQNKMMGHFPSDGKPVYIVIDASKLAGASRKARQLYMKSLKDLYKLHLYSIYILYGTNLFVSTAVRLGRSFMPFKVRIARDIGHAFDIIDKDKHGHPAAPNKGPHGNGDAVKAYEQDLLKFIGMINWEKKGSDEYDDIIDPQHPLASVFYSIRLIKEELDDLFAERRKSIKTLKESEKKYRELFEKGSDLLCLHDLEGKVLDSNFAFKKEYGLTRDQAASINIRNLIVPDHQHEFDDYLERIQSDGFARGLMTVTGADGREIVFDYYNVLVSDDKGSPLWVKSTARDVTDRIQAKREKKRLEKQLYQAQKMEAIGTLAGGIAHDFNNILMGIQGQASLLRYKLGAGSPLTGHLDGVDEYVISASDLTKQLLGFARGGKYEVRPLDINRVIEKSSRLFGRTRKEVEIHKTLQPEVWAVEADKGQIEQVLVNLYVNAFHAMPGGGKLMLETRNTVLDEKSGTPFPVAFGKYVKITVADTGVGMDKATRQKIFDPFFTTRKMGRGTGLGLASAYGIIKNHNGYIDVASKKGHGATFSIFLPASKKAVSDQKKASTVISTGEATILMVDDEKISTMVGSRMLETLGYKVIVADSGEKAVELYDRHKAGIDLVMLDMVMPGISGEETYSRLKKINPHIKVLVSSGYSLEENAAKMVKHGCSSFIQKPFDLPRLSKKIKSVLSENLT